MTAVHSGRTTLPRVLIALAAGVVAVLSGCGGGNKITPPGTPVITMAATNTRFASYVVTIDSISLSTSDGSLATPFYTPQTIDLARLTDLAELVETPAVPAATYVSAQIAFDYTSASVFVNEAGHAVAATLAAPGGTVPTTALVTVTFDPAHPLVITNPKSSRVHVIFDLDDFNTVNLSGTTPVVTVQPYAVINAAPADATPLRARGIFVITQSDSFIMNMRPFYDISSQLGALTVNISNATYFNINGVSYTGTAGLTALQGLPLNASVAAYGTLGVLTTITPGLNATSVYAGTSLEDGLQYRLIGVVAARSGNTLTLNNVQVLPALGVGRLGFLGTATATLATATIVSEDGVEASGLGIQSISVGQRVNIGGTATFNSTTGAFTGVDATAGQVRLQSTRAWGVLNSATPNSASLDLLALGEFAPASYNFAGSATGGGAVSPAAYEVNTGSVDESGTAASTLLAVDGQVAPFGAAPPAFNATAVTPGAATEQELVVEWISGGTTAPFTAAASAAGMTVNLSNAALGPLHAIYTGPQSLDIKTGLPASPLITTVGADQSKLLLSVGSAALGISVFESAASFATAVNSKLNGTNKAYRLVAFGQYNSAGNTFVATRINLAMQN